MKEVNLTLQMSLSDKTGKRVFALLFVQEVKRVGGINLSAVLFFVN